MSTKQGRAWKESYDSDESETSYTGCLLLFGTALGVIAAIWFLFFK